MTHFPNLPKVQSYEERMALYRAVYGHREAEHKQAVDSWEKSCLSFPIVQDELDHWFAATAEQMIHDMQMYGMAFMPKTIDINQPPPRVDDYEIHVQDGQMFYKYNPHPPIEEEKKRKPKRFRFSRTRRCNNIKHRTKQQARRRRQQRKRSLEKRKRQGK